MCLRADGPRRGAGRDAPPKEELAVIATNGHQRPHGNGNGNGKANGNGGRAGAITLSLGATKVSFQTQADAPSCAECGSIMVRNGSLLQVPELREHLRLQLKRGRKQPAGGGADTITR